MQVTDSPFETYQLLVFVTQPPAVTYTHSRLFSLIRFVTTWVIATRPTSFLLLAVLSTKTRATKLQKAYDFDM